MENFILYEELGTGGRSVVYKGRRKGSLHYVAIICSDKTKRSMITNHVRLCKGLNHQNIVSFDDWYETSNHLWQVVELCTGCSLESLIVQDGCLPEDVVKAFGRHIVQGLKYIHKTGIIYSDLTPAKILLDGQGILKLSNFCLSKAKGETLEEFFSHFSTPEEAGGGRGEEAEGGGRGGEEEEEEENLESDGVRGMIQGPRKKQLGSPAYSAPEVLQGAETTTSSDLWALGCILHYMYTGRPPFHSDDCQELKKMVLREDALPLRQTAFASGPTEEFQSLLRGLLTKNPDERMKWPEVLAHPFWAQLLEEEEEEEVEVEEEEVEGEGDEDEDEEEEEGERNDHARNDV